MFFRCSQNEKYVIYSFSSELRLFYSSIYDHILYNYCHNVNMQDIFDHILDELYERARMYVESVRRLTLGEVSNLSHWQNALSLD